MYEDAYRELGEARAALRAVEALGEGRSEAECMERYREWLAATRRIEAARKAVDDLTAREGPRHGWGAIRWAF